MNTYHETSSEPFETGEPSIDELLTDTLGLIDEIVRTRLAHGELARRRERIKAAAGQAPASARPDTGPATRRAAYPADGRTYAIDPAETPGADRHDVNGTRQCTGAVANPPIPPRATRASDGKEPGMYPIWGADPIAGGRAQGPRTPDGRRGRQAQRSVRTYYHRAGILVTDRYLTVAGHRYDIAELYDVWTVRGSRDPLGTGASVVAMAVVAIAVGWSFSGQPTIVSTAIVAAALVPAGVAVAAWRTRRRHYELWAEYRGGERHILTVLDGEVYGQICRAVIRAREARELREAREAAAQRPAVSNGARRPAVSNGARRPSPAF